VKNEVLVPIIYSVSCATVEGVISLDTCLVVVKESEINGMIVGSFVYSDNNF